MLKQLLLTLAVCCGSVISAQQNCSPEILRESRMALARADRFGSDSLNKVCPHLTASPGWVKGSDYVSFQRVDASGLKTFFLADAAHKRIIRLFSADEYAVLAAALAEKKIDPADPRFYVERVLEGDNNKLVCRVEGKSALFDIKQQKFTSCQPGKQKPSAPTFSSGKEPWKSYSRDSTFSITGLRHNIYLSRTGATGADSMRRLTWDGEAYYSYTNYHRTGETSDAPRSWRGEWFRDTHIAYCLRVDFRKVSTQTIVNSIAEPVPTAKEYKLELAGDKYVGQYEIALVYADSAKVLKADIAKFPDQEVKLARNFNRSVPFDAIYFTRRNRVGDTLELCAIDPFTACVSVIATEVSHPIVNEVLFNYAPLEGGKEFIWWSERTGKGAYYLYGRDGKMKNPITDRDLVAGKIFQIDTAGRTMIVEGYGYDKTRNPYYRKYYRVGLDGRLFIELTPGDGEHSIELSTDTKYILDTYSTVERMPRCEIRDLRGRLVMEIPMPDEEALLAAGWSRPRLEKVLAADNRTELYGIIYTPGDLDTTRKYPVICGNVYPGPHQDNIPQTFEVDHDGAGALAQMGFIVVQFGYRGSSPLRGREFFTFGYGNMRDYPLADCKYVVEQLAARYPWMDLGRVGIFGHSGGGLLSAAAILTYPDFFKVAVAVSGNHDNNIYGKYWAEPYHGVKPVYKTDSAGITRVEFQCRVPTTIELADRLKGRLMLVTGEIDDNVNPASTMRLANALIKNNKRFDLMILPGKDHGMYGNYYDNLIRYYFEQYLKDPKEFDVDIVRHRQ